MTLSMNLDTVTLPPLGEVDRAEFRGLRVGVPPEYFGPGLDPEVRASVMAALDRLSDAGAELVPVELPHTEYAVATYYLLATAECASNLARYDGIAYGHRTAKSLPLDEMIAASRAEGLSRGDAAHLLHFRYQVVITTLLYASAEGPS